MQNTINARTILWPPIWGGVPCLWVSVLASWTERSFAFYVSADFHCPVPPTPAGPDKGVHPKQNPSRMVVTRRSPVPNSAIIRPLTGEGTTTPFPRWLPVRYTQKTSFSVGSPDSAWRPKRPPENYSGLVTSEIDESSHFNRRQYVLNVENRIPMSFKKVTPNYTLISLGDAPALGGEWLAALYLLTRIPFYNFTKP